MGIAGQSQVMFHADLGRVLDPGVRTPEHCSKARRGHRAGDADLALVPHFRRRDRSALLVEEADRRCGEQEIAHAQGVGAGYKVAIVADDRGDGGGAIGRRGTVKPNAALIS
jgi:hypothetical protein